MLIRPPSDPSIDLERIKSYYNDTHRTSQSQLKNIIKRYDTDETSPFMNKGSLVDTLIFTPWLFKELFYVCDDVFEDYVLRFARHIIDECINSEEYVGNWLNNINQIILDTFQYFDYQKRWKKETKLGKKDLILSAIKMLTVSDGRAVITSVEHDQAKALAERAVSFIRNTYHDHFRNGWDVEVQKILHFDINNTPCRSMLDLMFTSSDRQNMEILPVDFKWTSSPLQFFDEIMQKFRYDFQAAFYTDGVQANFPNAFVHNFEIVVYSAADDQFERITLSDVDLNVGRYGMKITHTYNTGESKLIRNFVTHGYIDAMRMSHLDGSARRKYNRSSQSSIWG